MSPFAGLLLASGGDVDPGRYGADPHPQDYGAVDRIGDDLVPVAWTEDGLVEGLEMPGSEAWLLAVQWHPEVNADEEPAQQKIFDAFADQVRERAGSEGKRKS